jgi:hypothetical protein
MTVAEAQEKLETITRNLASSEISSAQRRNCQKQTARYHRIIQEARQEAYRSLASFSQTLLAMTGDTVFNRNQNAALITAAHLIRSASIEQLAVAVPAAIRNTPTKRIHPTRGRFPEFTKIAVCLLGLDNFTFSCERHIAIRTALQLSHIVDRPQIHQSVRRAQADTDKLGPKGRVLLAKICSSHRPSKPGPSTAAGLR